MRNLQILCPKISILIFRQALSLPQLHPVDVNRWLETIEPIRRGLRIHRACIEGDWQAAEAELSAPDLDAYLDLGQRRELLATMRASRLRRERAPDDSWLALYRELSDVLMRHQEPRARYLRLVRGTTDGDYRQDLAILARWFPQETSLRSILACFSDPRAAADIDTPPKNVDEPLYARLLRHLIQSPHNYYPVRRLWESLPADSRTRLWGSEPSPVEQISERLRHEHQRIQARLADPATQVAQLEQELEDLIRTGLIDARTIKMVDVASDVERYIRDFQRQDPWDRALRPALEAAKRKLGYLPPPVRDVRGWHRAIEQRIEGIVAWDELEVAWNDFNKRFNRRFTGFHTDAGPWAGFQALLRRWIECIDQAAPHLHWDLPQARQSRCWVALIDAWSESHEGRMYIEAEADRPQDLAALRDSYGRILEQIDRFALLHARLLETDGAPEYLEELHQVESLSRPVEQIKTQLTNPQAAPTIGSAYQAFVAERAPA